MTLSTTMAAYSPSTLLVLFAYGDGTVSTVTGPTDGWTAGPYVANWLDLGMWWRLSSGASTTVTITGTNLALNMQVYEIAGLNNTIDKSASTHGTAGTTLSSGTTAALSSAVQLCFAAFAVDGINTDWVSAYSNGYVKIDGSGTVNSWFDIATREVNSTATQSCTATVTSSGGPAGLIVTFPITPLASPKIVSQAVNRSYTYW
jgi:hypothetical protein